MNAPSITYHCACGCTQQIIDGCVYERMYIQQDGSVPEGTPPSRYCGRCGRLIHLFPTRLRNREVEGDARD